MVDSRLNEQVIQRSYKRTNLRDKSAEYVVFYFYWSFIFSIALMPKPPVSDECIQAGAPNCYW